LIRASGNGGATAAWSRPRLLPCLQRVRHGPAEKPVAPPPALLRSMFGETTSPRLAGRYHPGGQVPVGGGSSSTSSSDRPHRQRCHGCLTAVPGPLTDHGPVRATQVLTASRSGVTRHR
jgi:hypothetical protein